MQLHSEPLIEEYEPICYLFVFHFHSLLEAFVQLRDLLVVTEIERVQLRLRPSLLSLDLGLDHLVLDG